MHAPIPEPDDRRVLPSASTTPGAFAGALGQSLLLGFVGQIVFTTLQLIIAGGTHGRAEAGASLNKQLLLLGLPLLCAIGGALDGRAHPSSKVGHPLTIVLLFLVVGILGLFNLLVLAFTDMPGYC